MILPTLLLFLSGVAAQEGNSTTTSSNGTTPTDVASAAVPSATVPLDTPVIGQGVLPPPQWWCNNKGNGTYCPGALLQDVELAGIFPDSKTFVDKPTNGTLNQTMDAFYALGNNKTVGQIITFVDNYFKPEGQELEEVQIQGFVENPAILNNITDPIYRAWVSRVNSYWSLLIRQTNQSAVCQPGVCESSLIPLNYTIVVPGGRYREIYYWDSFWIMEGLLSSELYTYAWNLLQNFMDMIDEYGFLPNGGRKYYLNRSQPPVFTQMVDQYVKATGNVSVLTRALPLLSAELEWFQVNRTINVTSPFTNVTHRVAHWAVNNSAPRPEGYVEDYETAFGAKPALNESQRSDLYAELASGAESGWDYSSRWCREPLLNVTDNNEALRTLNIRKIIPVDLTALLSGNHATLARLYTQYQDYLLHNMTTGPFNSTTTTSTASAQSSPAAGAPGMGGGGGGAPGMGADSTAALPPVTKLMVNPPSSTAKAMICSNGMGFVTSTNGSCPSTNSSDSFEAKIKYHQGLAADYAAAVNDLHWDAEKAYWYDFNLTSNTHTNVYSQAGLWPLWQGVVPPLLTTNETLALRIFSGMRFLLNKYAGPPTPATLLQTGLNWDFENVWPNHVHTSIRALENLLDLFPSATPACNIDWKPKFNTTVPGQLGVNETQLQPQPAETIGNTSLIVPGLDKLPWPQYLAIQLASRYMTSAFCSWYSTGGQLPGVLEQLPLSDLNATGTYTGGDGHMFEKFNVTDPDAAGGGGEYNVVTGFGWTNGVALWIAGHYGKYLPRPTCPLIPIVANNVTTNGNATSTGNATMGSNTSTLATRDEEHTKALFRGYRIPRK